MELNIKHINRRQLGDKIGVSESYVSLILRRKRVMSSLQVFRKMAVVLGVTMEELLEVIEAENPPYTAGGAKRAKR